MTIDETGTHASPTLASMERSFQRSLAALNRTERTRQTYRAALRALGHFLDAQGMPVEVAAIRREHVEAFMADLLTRRTPKTALTYYASLGVFFQWLIEEGEIRESPMRHMHPPHVPETLAPVLSDDEVRRLLRACEGTSFEDRRDLAMIRLFLDTGMRRAELTGITLDDLDLDVGVARVFGKGQRWRVCPFGNKTGLALDRYIRQRERQRLSDLPQLWLGRSGPLSLNAVTEIIKERGKRAKIAGLHPHLFRHFFASAFLAAGGQETDLLTLAGWRSRAMLQRYGAAAAAERAKAAHKKLGILDRF